MAKKSGILLSIFSLLFSLAAVPAGATTVRVNTIGQPALLPDAQEDLNQAPVFIHDLKERRLFADAGFSVSDTSTKRITAGPVNRTTSETKSLTVSLAPEYVDPTWYLPYAVRYKPSVTESRSTANNVLFLTDRFTNTHTRNLGALRGILGFGGKAAWKGAVSASYDETYTESNHYIFTGDTGAKGGTSKVNASLVTGAPGKPRLAALVGGEYGVSKSSQIKKSSSDTITKVMRLRLIPEIPAGPDQVWRFLAESSYSDARTHQAVGSSAYSTVYTRTYVLGAGWTRTLSSGTLWHSDSVVSDTHALNGNSASFRSASRTLNGSWRVGLEQPFTKSVVGRVGVNILTYNETGYDDSSPFNTPSRTWSFSGTRFVGLGFRPSPTLGFDLSLSSITGGVSGNNTQTATTSTESHTSSLSVSLAMDMSFR